jgi:hypothetical protein
MDFLANSLLRTLERSVVGRWSESDDIVVSVVVKALGGRLEHRISHRGRKRSRESSRIMLPQPCAERQHA